MLRWLQPDPRKLIRRADGRAVAAELSEGQDPASEPSARRWRALLAGAAPGSCRLADVKVVHGCAAARLRTLTASQQDWFAQRRQQLIYRSALRSVLQRPIFLGSLAVSIRGG